MNIDENYEGPNREKTSKFSQFGWNARQKYGNLLPLNLEKWLSSRLGYNWDEVYAELCARFTDLFLRYELDWQIKWCVHTDIYKERGGEIVDSQGAKIRHGFYVLDGILVETPKPPKYRPYSDQSKREYKRVYWVDGKVFAKIDNIWYELILKEYTQIVVPYDAFFKTQYSWPDDRKLLYGDAKLYCERKLQLNSTEIKRYKLNG